ncbi:MAG: nucleotidyltransferase domain-containing protein [Peptococcaceae bacterium]|nr:nucleotidyltransferase domain-containing protein [Peptococcaceae bacterium]
MDVILLAKDGLMVPAEIPEMLPTNIVQTLTNIGLPVDYIREKAREMGLQLMVLFGSYATGDFDDDSDLDLAFDPGPDNPVTEEQVRNALQDRTGVYVHPLPLPNTSPAVRAEVALTGICLFESKPGTWEKYCIRALSEWEKLRPAYERQIKDEWDKDTIPHDEIEKYLKS